MLSRGKCGRYSRHWMYILFRPLSGSLLEGNSYYPWDKEVLLVRDWTCSCGFLISYLIMQHLYLCFLHENSWSFPWPLCTAFPMIVCNSVIERPPHSTSLLHSFLNIFRLIVKTLSFSVVCPYHILHGSYYRNVIQRSH